MKCTNQYQTEATLAFLSNTKRTYSGEYKPIALWTAVTGQQRSLTEDVMQLYSWPLSSCSASAQANQGRLCAGGFAEHRRSWEPRTKSKLLLSSCSSASGTFWDACRPSFNRRDSKAIQKEAVKTLPWESAFQTSQDEEGAGCCPPLPWGSTSKGSAISSLAASF